MQLNYNLVIYSSITAFSWFKNICYFKEHCCAMLLLYQCARPLNASFYVSLTKYSIFLDRHERNRILKILNNLPNVTQLDQDRPRIWSHIRHSSFGRLLPHCPAWSSIPWYSCRSPLNSNRAQGERLTGSFNPFFNENSGKLWVSKQWGPVSTEEIWV